MSKNTSQARCGASHLLWLQTDVVKAYSNQRGVAVSNCIMGDDACFYNIMPFQTNSDESQHACVRYPASIVGRHIIYQIHAILVCKMCVIHITAILRARQKKGKATLLSV